jgi:preprotein translocase subunit SecA
MLGSLTNTLKKLFGDKAEKDLKELKPYATKANVEFDKLTNLSNDELRGKTIALKKQIADHIQPDEIKIAKLKAEAEAAVNELDKQEALYQEIDKLIEGIDENLEKLLLEILPEAFAVVKETARRFTENESIEVTATDFDRDLAATRESIVIQGDKALWSNTWKAGGADVTWNMIHYDVQLVGGTALHQGKVAEMMTGEGKTLVATLPVYLNALTGKGVHLVTVNDYLAKRDSEWMGPLYQFHGLTVDCIDKHQPNSEERRNAYKCDVVFGTNNEFGFDYLRDNMATNPTNLVQQKHHFAIVDEVDSVLIDDARTPLIISGPTPRGDIHEFDVLKPKIERLVGAQRKLITGMLSEAKKTLKDIEGGQLTKEQLKEGGLALFRAFRGLPKNNALIKFLSEPGIRTHLQKTENYYLQDQEKEMPVADEPLFFTIDEKNNGIQLTDNGVDLISTSSEDADFYIMPDVGARLVEIEKSGGTDAEILEQKETLTRDYSVKSERIHTMNQLLKAYTLFRLDDEYIVVDGKVKIVDEQTGRMMEGRRYSDGLHQAIEAKENVKIEDATQTYATVTLQNYFRMYHKLSGMTGTAETEAKELWDIYELDVVVVPTNRPIQRADDNDLVYKTKREKYNAIAEEVAKMREEGRPVLVGTTSVEVSELLSRMLKLKNVDHNVLNAKLHQRESEIVAGAGQAGAVTIATNMAGRGTDIKLGKGVIESGGLAIMGTERHDSRRVDRQLRGRSGRQGDPGSSQFFVSLEDNLMRLFGSERIAKLMDRMGLEDGEVIQHGMITKSIERAQKKVEENNFGTRKHLLEYDDVMNVQREAIYKKRRHALHGERLSLDISNSFYDVSSALVLEYKEFSDYEGFKFELLRTLALEPPFDEQQFLDKNDIVLTDELFAEVIKGYKRRCDVIAKDAFPVISNVYENESTYENIVVPFTDGIKTLQTVANLEKCFSTNGQYLITELEKGVTLGLIDLSWKEHLREMDDLRSSVQQARYEQKDPLLIYKFESFELFKTMMNKINIEIASFLLKANLPIANSQEVRRAPAPKAESMKNLQTSRPGSEPQGGQQRQGGRPQAPQPQKVEPVRVEKKVGRNDPCPCGSGKKFKQCHGKAQA